MGKIQFFFYVCYILSPIFSPHYQISFNQPDINITDTSMNNLQSLEVVDCGSEAQLQVRKITTSNIAF